MEASKKRSAAWQALTPDLQIRKVAEGVYMLRQGPDGTAIAITDHQLALLLKKSTN